MASLTHENKNVSLKSAKVPECTNVKQANKIFKSYEKEGLPFFTIEKGCKCGKIEYDFIATNYQLKKQALAEVQNIFEEMTAHLDIHNLSRPAHCTAGKIYGISLKYELSICRHYTPIIMRIVFNQDNWELSYNGKMQKAVDDDNCEALKLQIEGNREK